MPDFHGCREPNEYGSRRQFLAACVKERDGLSFVNWLHKIGAEAIREKGSICGKFVSQINPMHAYYLAAMVEELELFIYGEWIDGNKYAK